MPYRALRRRLNRRSFVGGSLGAATAAVLPPGGVFAGGGDTIRIGIVGCGGRGTGAAIQAAAADPGVVITAVGGLFPDEVASSSDRLAAALGPRFACSTAGRCIGPTAADRVIAADVDAVILATPPHLRPGHVAAAVAAGRHVYCETPAAVDAAGVGAILAAADEAARRGLSFVSGLLGRRDAATVATIASIHDGGLGRVTGAAAVARVLPPWRREPQAGWTAAEARLRNWVADERLSGGPFVEHHIHAIDRALWALGDEPPVAAVALRGPVPLPPPSAAAPRVAAVRLLFADGRWIDVGIDRRAGVETGSAETVYGTLGDADLRDHVVAGRPVRGSGGPSDPLAAAAAALLQSLRSGTRVDDLPAVCRSTLAAVMARMACETPGPVRWRDLEPAGTTIQPLRPLQWDAV